MVNFSTILVHVQVWSQIKYMHIHSRHLQILDIREWKWEENKVIHPHVFFCKEKNKTKLLNIFYSAQYVEKDPMELIAMRLVANVVT